jgi:predicted ATPase
MITHLRAENFKSWRDTGDLRFAQLTGIFGPNSSGKTSLLQILLMLRQTTDTYQLLNLGGDDRSLVDLGTFQDVIRGHDTNAVLRLVVSWDPVEDPNLKRSVTGPLTYDVRLGEKDGQIRLVELKYSFSDRVASMRLMPDETYEIDYNGEHLEGVPPLRFPNCTTIPAKGLKEDTRTLTSLHYEPGFVFRKIVYLGPLRTSPRRSYLWAGTRPAGVASDGRDAMQVLLAQRDGTTTERVAHWLKRMNMIDSFRIVPIAPRRRDHEVLVRTSPGGSEVLLTDVGFGLSQILPVLVLCAAVPVESIVILEQPEIHLHPAVQSDLADVLIDAMKTRKLQIILESHSEHLLRRIQRRIAEEVISTKDAALYFCESEHGESKARELEITEEGFIKNWPKDFFGDEMGDLAALTESAARRRLTHVE